MSEGGNTAKQKDALSERQHLGRLIDRIGELEDRLSGILSPYASSERPKDTIDKAAPASPMSTYFSDLRDEIWRGEHILSNIEEFLDRLEL